MKRIYLDYAASTPVDARVLRAMEPYFSEQFGNPGSLHAFGQEAIAAVDRSRETIARVLGADFREIVFTGSATEANNLALRGVLRTWRDEIALRNQPSHPSGGGERPALSAKNRPSFTRANQAFSPPRSSAKQFPPRLIVSAIEHESILETAHDLKQEGADVVVIPVDRRGHIDMKKLVRALDERTVLVSVMYANNEIGTVQPIAEISAAIRRFRERQKKGIWPFFHIDAVQAFQLLPCDVGGLGVNLMTLSAHKLYGPKGVGMLYARGARNQELESRNGARKSVLSSSSYLLTPILTGGGQEFGLRSGTENVPAIVGFAEAVVRATALRQQEAERLRVVLKAAWSGIRRAIPGVQVNGLPVADKNHLPNMLNVYVPGMKAEELLTRLDLAHIAASSGSACSARAQEPSHVILALGHSMKRARESVRFSFGRQTTKRDIDTLVSVLKQLFRTR